MRFFKTFPAWGWLENASGSCLSGADGLYSSLTGTASNWCDSTFLDLGQLFQFNPHTGSILTAHSLNVETYVFQRQLVELAPTWKWSLDQSGQLVNQQWDGPQAAGASQRGGF